MGLEEPPQISIQTLAAAPSQNISLSSPVLSAGTIQQFDFLQNDQILNEIQIIFTLVQAISKSASRPGKEGVSLDRKSVV